MLLGISKYQKGSRITLLPKRIYLYARIYLTPNELALLSPEELSEANSP